MSGRKRESERMDMRADSGRERVGKWIVGGVLILGCLLFWFPVIIMGTHTWMGEEEFIASYGRVFGMGSQEALKPRLFPLYPTMAPLIKVLLDSPEFFVMFWNSVKQVFPVLAGQLLVGAPAAWAFGRYQFVGRRFLLLLYMILMIMPFQVTMVSSYLVLSRVHLLDTCGAVILPGMFSAFPVFLMYKFFQGIPKSLLEAAQVDGAGQIIIFLRIGIPLGMPGILSSVLLNFLEYWNAIEQPMTFIKNRSRQPLALYLSQMTADQMGSSFAASLLTMLPAILIFLWGQEYLEQGIAASGIKE